MSPSSALSRLDLPEPTLPTTATRLPWPMVKLQEEKVYSFVQFV